MIKRSESSGCDGKHTFALYIPSLVVKNKKITITDSFVIRRISQVLRLSVKDSIILFDDFSNYSGIIITLHKREVVVEVVDKKDNVNLVPRIVVGLPLLKKDALSTAIYNCVELGASEIHLIKSNKSQQRWSASDHERLVRVAIAAAEQSKNFSIPDIREPISLQNFCSQEKNIFWADVNGTPLWETISPKNISNFDSLALLVGPEGDFTHDEKNFLYDQKVNVLKLTPTILRSIQALSVMLGYVRSI